jgi:hypothetical protein
MAFRQSIKFRGIDLPASYKRINSIRFDAPQKVFIKLDTYASEEAANNEEQPIESVSVTTTLEAIGATKASLTIKKAYTGIKAIREDLETAEDA